jgi:serine/threonine protein phosphatase 1
MKKTYAIGDIHGMSNMLLELLDKIVEDDATEKRLVFLGDYVDRGPDSKGVLDMLMELQKTRQYKGVEFESVVCLKGNHEHMMEQALKHPHVLRLARLWLINGGVETMDNFGEDVPPSYVRWIENLPTVHEDEHRIYVHAGLHPMDTTNKQSHMWIREYFVDVDHDFGKLVVHGHTAAQNPDGSFTEQPWVCPYRLGIDTGSCFGGQLTCAVFDDAALRHLYFLHAK